MSDRDVKKLLRQHLLTLLYMAAMLTLITVLLTTRLG